VINNTNINKWGITAKRGTDNGTDFEELTSLDFHNASKKIQG
jgi:hypothetical protein